MGWMIRVLGLNSQWGLGIFLFTTASRTALGPAQLPLPYLFVILCQFSFVLSLSPSPCLSFCVPQKHNFPKFWITVIFSCSYLKPICYAYVNIPFKYDMYLAVFQ
jgi:hypothetical protein